jgi:hypothetical protein
MVAVDAVVADVVDTDADTDEARTILARSILQKKGCVLISAPMSLTMVKSLQQV